MALNHATTLYDDTNATLVPDPLLTDIEALNRKHAFVMNGGKAMVMNFGRDLKRGEPLTFSCQADFRARYANRSTLVLCEDGTRLAPLTEQWWSHPQRREYAGLVFAGPTPGTRHGPRAAVLQPVPVLARARDPETGRDARDRPGAIQKYRNKDRLIFHC